MNQFGARLLWCVLIVGLGLGFGMALDATPVQPHKPQELDPAAGGVDHVGQAVPAYMTGDECLFCHRDIGKTWPGNPHHQTLRPALPEDRSRAWLTQVAGGDTVLQQADFLMGKQRVARALKRSSKYGRLELASIKAFPTDAPHEGRKEPTAGASENVWLDAHFADRCAGCHCTAVDTQSRAFSTVGLDCYVCHGVVDLAHTQDVGKVLLSSTHRSAKQVASICGQCHLRGGHSKSTRLPYPNTFVPGDNLFRDFQVDLSPSQIQAMTPTERHIFQNVRDVVVLGKEQITCLSCHQVHGNDVGRHREVQAAAICGTCHQSAEQPEALLENYQKSLSRGAMSPTCEY